MRRWWTRRWKTVVIVVGALLAIVIGSMLLKVAGLDPNAFAAVASAAAAIAAFASARESSETARQAVRALSFATKPTLRVRLFNWDADQEPMLVIENVSTHTVTRATVTWKMRNGQHGQQHTGHIPGLNQPWDMSNKTALAPNERVMLPQLWGTPGTDIITIDYWGQPGTNGWRATWQADWTFGNDGHIATMGSQQRVTTDIELT